MAPSKRKIHKTFTTLMNDGITAHHSETLTRFVCIINGGVVCGIRNDFLLEKCCACGPVVQFMPVFQKSYVFVAFETLANTVSCIDMLDDVRLFQGAPKINVCCLQEFPLIPHRSVALPPGLSLIERFHPRHHDPGLMEYLHTCYYQELRNRSVCHLGFMFDYRSNNAYVETKPIPPVIQNLIVKLTPYFPAGLPNQVTINRYKSGGGIPMHVDTHSAFDETIACLSLGTAVNMEFQHAANAAQVYEIQLTPGSLMVMQGEARYCYKHAIRPRKTDVNPFNGHIETRGLRYSVTFRKVRFEKCQCPYTEYCDWNRDGATAIPTNDEEARLMEKVYVQGTYEGIAEHFDFTRYAKWKTVMDFFSLLPPFSFVVDAGCGNGKYLNSVAGHAFVGFDMCKNLLKVAGPKGEVFAASALEIPIVDNSVDAVISVAVIHHFSTRSRRSGAIKEIARILRPGGLACVTVWAFNQTEGGIESIYAQMRAARITEGSEVREDPTQLAIHDGSVFTHKDMLVPWQKGNETPAFRYYHLFEPNELEHLILSFGNLKVVQSHYEQGNYCVVFEKQF